MAYEKKISRQYPGLIVAVLDDSGSMGDKMAGTSDPRYKWVERYFGHILDELLARSTEVQSGEAVVKPRYYLRIIPYGSKPQLWGEPEMDIKATVERFTKAKNSLGLGGKLGGTDAKAALELAYSYIEQAVSTDQFKDSFPPMVFHLTDGESWTDATKISEQISQLSTNDGNILMVNAYIGTQTSLNYTDPEDFPGYINASEAGPSRDNTRLFNMSSQAPASIEENLKSENIFPKLRTGSRLFFDVRTKEMLKHVIQVIGSMGSRMAR